MCFFFFNNILSSLGWLKLRGDKFLHNTIVQDEHETLYINLCWTYMDSNYELVTSFNMNNISIRLKLIQN